MCFANYAPTFVFVLSGCLALLVIAIPSTNSVATNLTTICQCCFCLLLVVPFHLGFTSMFVITLLLSCVQTFEQGIVRSVIVVRFVSQRFQCHLQLIGFQFVVGHQTVAAGEWLFPRSKCHNNSLSDPQYQFQLRSQTYFT